MRKVVFAYLRKGGVYRDYESWENGDRLGSYVIIHGSDGRYVETDSIGGRRYTGLWVWDENENDEKNYGIVPLITNDQ